jgi:uncharacterized protein (DUF952 family)
MNTIYHIAQNHQWENAKQTETYQTDSLKTEGFIHCSTIQQVIKTANRFFANQKGLVLLCINCDKVKCDIRYEGADGDEFPHIYGELNIDAVHQVLDFEAGDDGFFLLPDGVVSR